MITKKSIKGKYDNSSKQSTCTKTKRRIIKILKKLESEIELDLFNIKKESKPVALDQQAV